MLSKLFHIYSHPPIQKVIQIISEGHPTILQGHPITSQGHPDIFFRLSDPFHRVIQPFYRGIQSLYRVIQSLHSQSLHRVIQPPHRVIQPLHRVIQPPHRVIQPFQRSFNPFHRVIQLFHPGNYVCQGPGVSPLEFLSIQVSSPDHHRVSASCRSYHAWAMHVKRRGTYHNITMLWVTHFMLYPHLLNKKINRMCFSMK